MAGLIQVGDIVKITEVAWKVYEYGWSNALNASKLIFPILLMLVTYGEDEVVLASLTQRIHRSFT